LAHLLADSDFLPRASLYEAINLKAQHLPPFQRLSLVADPLYSDTYYVYHAGGVNAISMCKWVEKLGELITNFENGKGSDAERGLTAWLNEKVTSQVRLIVNSSPFQTGFVPIVGLVLITDIYLSYSLLALTCDYRLVTADLNMRRDISATKESEIAVKAQLQNIVGNEDAGYQPLLSLPAFQPPKHLDTLPKQAKIIVPPEMGGSKELVITEETLRFFNKSSEQIRRETHDLKKAATKIDSRLTMQQKEFERQVTTLTDLYDRLQLVQSPEAKSAQEQKLRDLSSRHAKLRLRIDEQLRKLMNIYQPDLSNEEKDWIAKLEKLSKEIGGESGYKARIELVIYNLCFLICLYMLTCSSLVTIPSPTTLN
jgi:nucleoporin NUP82